ncbi:hypothetical protein [Pseudogemmobacter bohemicus]|uniref:hypothetical protein n=1 Tax=Pseudogemmobacter bohemicus TaxID=2250708 RepID=UPI000DD3A224|nr:hypothetical protein [Pseudogemmobacter bohemicus]
MSGSDIASRYIGKSGRTATYDRKTWADDLMILAGFRVWAEEDGAFYGGERAASAYAAACRMLDLDGIGLRNIMLGGKL